MFNADAIQDARLEHLLPLVSDMHRFAQSHWTSIEKAPLQAYSSALIFSPANSLTRKLFAFKEPEWIVQKPRVEQSWNSCLVTLTTGKLEASSSVAFSPDGRHIVSGFSGGTIKIWHAETGAETLTLQSGREPIWWITFDEGCKFISSRSDGQTIKVWDTELGASIYTCQCTHNPKNKVIFSPDQRRYATCVSYDDTIHIMDTGSNTEVLTLRGHTGSVWSVDFSPDGHYIASGSSDTTVKIWDAVTGDEISTLQGESGKMFSVCFSPDGRQLVSGSESGTVQIWDVESSAGTSTLQGRYGHREIVSSVALSLDGRRIASGSNDCTVKIWDTETAHVLQTITFVFEILCVTLSPSGNRIAASTAVVPVTIADAESGATIWESPRSLGLAGVGVLALSLDGCHIAIGSGEDVVIQDAESVKSALTLRGHSDRVTSLAFSPKDWHIVASTSADETVKIWNAATGTNISSLNVGVNMFLSRFDSTGAFLYATSNSFNSSRSVLLRYPLWSVNSNSSQTDFVLPKFRQDAYGVREDSEGFWITWYGQNILLLPPEIQTYARAGPPRPWDVLPDMISIGCLSGRVLWLKFSPEHLRFAHKNR